MRGRHKRGTVGRLCGLALLTGAALALSAAQAFAAMTIGQTGTAVTCDDATSQFQASVETGADYAAAAPGVITSYSTVAGSTVKTRKLIVLVDQGSNNWAVTQKDVVRATMTPSALNVYTGLHIPIQAGERIGYSIPDQTVDGGDCLTFGVPPDGAPDDVYRHALGEPAIGVPTGFGAFQSGGRINLSATIELDADGDGFGDETQDGCPADAAAQGPCPLVSGGGPTPTQTSPTPTQTSPTPTKKKCKKGKHHRAVSAKKKCKKKRK